MDTDKAEKTMRIIGEEVTRIDECVEAFQCYDDLMRNGSPTWNGEKKALEHANALLDRINASPEARDLLSGIVASPDTYVVYVKYAPWIKYAFDRYIRAAERLLNLCKRVKNY